MNNRIVFIILLTALALSGCATTKPSNDYGRPGELVDAALVTFNNFSADPNMTWFRNNIDRARAVIIFPRVVRAGFVFGGSGGSGTMLLRDQSTGEWTYPAFFSMGKGSFGFQAGVDVAEVVLMVMTQRGVDRFLSPSFQLGADASIAAGPVGAGASAALADILAFSRARGVFGGLSVEGGVINPRNEWNSAYYGRNVRTVDILIKRNVSNPQADGLRAAVARKAAQ
ncbi:MAG: lipid-binding SYLF domain-containing protein [Desulfobacterales bacterium]